MNDKFTFSASKVILTAPALADPGIECISIAAVLKCPRSPVHFPQYTHIKNV